LPVASTQYNGAVSYSTPDVCNPSVTIVSSLGGCDVLQNSIIWEYFDLMKPYLGAIGIGVGIPLCFLGLKLIKPAICFIAFITMTCMSLFIFYAIYINSIELTPVFWYFLGGGAAAGIIVGLLAARFVKYGAACLAGWGGFCLGIILNEAVLSKLT